jgi:hypothetical protein
MSGRSQNKRNLSLDITVVLVSKVFFYQGLPDYVWFSLEKLSKFGDFYWNFSMKIGHQGERAKVEHEKLELKKGFKFGNSLTLLLKTFTVLIFTLRV